MASGGFETSFGHFLSFKPFKSPSSTLSLFQTRPVGMDPHVVAGDSPNLDRPASNQPASANTAAALPAAQGPDHGWHPWHSVVGLMGYGSRGTLLRKHAFTLAFKLVLGIAQITAIAVLSAISARTQSPTKPGITEWEACDRPLGAWLIVWAVRVALGLAISIYSFILIRPGLLEFTYDPANGIEENAVPNNQTLPPPVGPLNGPGQPQFIHAGRVHPVPRALQSFTTILSFLSLVWFIASHIL
ncbi:4338_t:CDS:2, partial [Acaulospora colombiana]